MIHTLHIYIYIYNNGGFNSDIDHSGSINFEEFFATLDLEYSAFAERAFSIMDVENTSTSYHRLEFDEFFVGVYNYCTMDHDYLVKFAFDTFDTDGRYVRLYCIEVH